MGVLALVLGLAGCADLRPLSAGADGPRQGWWVELDDARRLEFGPGITVELPDAPYRAKFEDAQGVYFQAAAPIVFRTVHGVTNAVEGGLYVRNDRPDEATAWIYPQLGAGRVQNVRPVRVRLMRGA